mmetsp:Transcript_9538/g.12627  ORF Transcript_9538/g.12627 Transcript_9538/m.12627 type:complete len:334 (-) Transcript_9538:291-1292(-)
MFSRGGPGKKTINRNALTTDRLKVESQSFVQSDRTMSATNSIPTTGSSLDRNELGPGSPTDGADDVRIPNIRLSPDDESFIVKIVEEAPPLSNLEKEWLTAMGRVEVVLLEDEDLEGQSVNRRFQIICLPTDSLLVSPLLRRSHIEGGILDPEVEEVSPNMFEQLAGVLLESCVVTTGCGSECNTMPKSALRKDDNCLRPTTSVSFDKVDIHEFNMTLGNHPSAVTGPPVMLDSEDKSRASSWTLDDYERNRGARRTRKNLKMSMKTRCGILQKEANFSAKDITKAWEEAMVVRRQRRETLKGGVAQMAYEDFWESATRKLHRMIDSLYGMIL